MASKRKRFADDGWAVWVDGDDNSTVYINDWLNPAGNSYVDFAVRIRGVKAGKGLHVFIPFFVSHDEIEDVSLSFENEDILRATFGSACIIDFKKNKQTSEVAYRGKTIDIVHISTVEFTLKELAGGCLFEVDLEKIRDSFDNDEAYFLWRMPHKTLDEVFNPGVDVENVIEHLRELITSPVVFQKFGYSIRINESRLLPEEINRIGAFHRQKLKKAVITISVDESYELNDAGCYRIRRLEENLYKSYLPADYDCEDVISYQWNQNREDNLLGQFNFYFSIMKSTVSHGSMFVYLAILLTFGATGNMIWSVISYLLNLQL